MTLRLMLAMTPVLTLAVKKFKRLLLAALLAGTSVADASHGILPPALGGVPVTGFLVRAEHRFDPAIQRLMAERSLRALPLRDGQLFFVYPIDIDPRLEEMQIRYLEVLLEKRQQDEPDQE